jgi:hypothetical protein
VAGGVRLRSEKNGQKALAGKTETLFSRINTPLSRSQRMF